MQRKPSAGHTIEAMKSASHSSSCVTRRGNGQLPGTLPDYRLDHLGLAVRRTTAFLAGIRGRLKCKTAAHSDYTQMRGIIPAPTRGARSHDRPNAGPLPDRREDRGGQRRRDRLGRFTRQIQSAKGGKERWRRFWLAIIRERGIRRRWQRSSPMRSRRKASRWTLEPSTRSRPQISSVSMGSFWVVPRTSAGRRPRSRSFSTSRSVILESSTGRSAAPSPPRRTSGEQRDGHPRPPSGDAHPRHDRAGGPGGRPLRTRGDSGPRCPGEGELHPFRETARRSREEDGRRLRRSRAHPLCLRSLQSPMSCS